MAEPIIRPIRFEDAADYHELRTQPGVIWGTLQLPTLSRELVREHCGPQPGVHLLVAEVEGKMVGSIGLHLEKGRRRHSASLGMSIHDAYQGKGLGTRLMAEALDLADNWLMLERVWLSVQVDNPRAVRLYRNFGFVEEGTLRKSILRDGTYVDIYDMARLRGRAAEAAAQGRAGGVEGLLSQSGPRPGAGAGGTGRSRPEKLNIRVVHPDDIPALHALFLHPEVLPHLDFFPTLHVEELRRELANPPRGHHVLVAEMEGEVVGFASLTQRAGRMAHIARVNAVAVHPAWQGNGIGSALLADLLDLARNWLGHWRVEAAVPVTASRAMALLQGFGFHPEAVHRASLAHGGTFVDEVVMARVTAP